MKSILETIAIQIRYHEEKLSELKIAQRVVAGLSDIPLTLAGEPISDAPEAKFTVRRKKPADDAPKPKAKTTVSRSKLRQQILVVLSDRQRSTKEIMALIYPHGSPDKAQMKSVWNALAAMTSDGKIARIETGVYALPGEKAPAPLEASPDDPIREFL